MELKKAELRLALVLDSSGGRPQVCVRVVVVGAGVLQEVEAPLAWNTMKYPPPLSLIHHVLPHAVPTPRCPQVTWLSYKETGDFLQGSR